MTALPSKRSSLLHRWQHLSAFQRRWLIGIALGVVVEALLILGSVLHVSAIQGAQNWALDSMMRAHARRAQDLPESHPDLRRMALVAVDDSVWRDARWGGGEPALAPREQLAKLVQKALEAGARQVVLDVLVESAGASPAEDQQFAVALREMLKSNQLDSHRRLVLVRTLRQPPDLDLTNVANPDWEADKTGARRYLPELRAAPAVDQVVEESGGRIVVAAPYFKYSSDRVLRDWELFQTVCERHRVEGGPDGGNIRVVPAVQLVVAAFMKGVDDRALPWTGTRGGQVCRPFRRPYDGNGTVLSATETAAAFDAEAGDPRQLAALVNGVSNGAWVAMRTAFAHTDIHVPATQLIPGSLANRVVFRYAAPPLTISAMDLLSEARLPDLRDHVVVIGQTFAENRDMHVTPIGVMPGAVVLMNAVDSMVRHRVVEKPHPALVWSLTAILLVLVAGFNARFSVNVAGTLCTAVLIIALLPLSYWLFKYGVWLDFALPLLAVLGHALYELIKHSGGHEHDAGSANHHHA